MYLHGTWPYLSWAENRFDCWSNFTFFQATTMSLVVDSLLSIGEFGWTVAQLLTFTLIDSVKTFIPMGVLPRKSIKGTSRSWSLIFNLWTSGDICLITGAGSGLGRLMALEVIYFPERSKIKHIKLSSPSTAAILCCGMWTRPGMQKRRECWRVVEPGWANFYLLFIQTSQIQC